MTNNGSLVFNLPGHADRRGDLRLRVPSRVARRRRYRSPARTPTAAPPTSRTARSWHRGRRRAQTPCRRRRPSCWATLEQFRHPAVGRQCRSCQPDRGRPSTAVGQMAPTTALSAAIPASRPSRSISASNSTFSGTLGGYGIAFTNNNLALGRVARPGSRSRGQNTYLGATTVNGAFWRPGRASAFSSSSAYIVNARAPCGSAAIPFRWARSPARERSKTPTPLPALLTTGNDNTNTIFLRPDPQTARAEARSALRRPAAAC